MKRYSSRGWQVVLLSCALLSVGTACGDDPGPSVSEPAPEVAETEMIGTWESITGALIQVSADHSVTISDLPTDVWELTARTGDVSLAGTWKLCDERLAGGGVVCSDSKSGVDVQFEGVIQVNWDKTGSPEGFAESGEVDIIRAELSGGPGKRELYVSLGPDVTELERHRFVKQ